MERRSGKRNSPIFISSAIVVCVLSKYRAITFSLVIRPCLLHHQLPSNPIYHQRIKVRMVLYIYPSSMFICMHRKDPKVESKH